MRCAALRRALGLADRWPALSVMAQQPQTRPPARGARDARHAGVARAWRVALYYLGAWATIAILAPRTWLALGAVAAIAVATTVPLVRFFRNGGWRAYPTAAFRVLVVRPVLYTQLLLPLAAGAGLVGLAIGAPWGASIATGRVLAGVVFAVMVLLFTAGYIGSGWLVVRQVEATVPGLSDAWEGTSIAQISDLHVGPQTSRRFLARVADTVAALNPDLIAITGDLVDDQAEDVAHFAAAVESLHAPLGVYLIPGNHDVYAGWSEVDRRLRAALPRATILVNEARILERDGVRLAVVGTGDPAGRRAATSRRTWSAHSKACRPARRRSRWPTILRSGPRWRSVAWRSPSAATRTGASSHCRVGVGVSPVYFWTGRWGRTSRVRLYSISTRGPATGDCRSGSGHTRRSR